MSSTGPAGIGLRSERGPVLVAVMLTSALVALDSTIIATAIPSVVADLGGFSQFPWLFSVYLLAQAVSAPIYGKLADVLGRKPVLLFGISLFVLGSVLCGVAWSLPALIAARAVQGLGAGAVQSIGMTVVGDLYSPAERARVQGYLASVWGISAVVGPILGGVFSDYLSWRWIFFINVPIGAVAAWLLLRAFHERVTRTAHQMDYLGAALLAAGFSLLILGLLEGGVAWDWTSPTGLLVVAAGVVLLAVFTVVERRAAEPVLPPWVVTRRTLVGGNLVAVAVGATVLGFTSYIPTYVQGVLETGALLAGLTVASLTLGWPIASALSGRLYLRIGYRDTALIGLGVVIVGVLLSLLLGRTTAVWQVAVACAVVGVGLGLSVSPTIVAVQSVVGWERRGVVTATNMFSRSMGSAVGVAVFGAVANHAVHERLSHAPPAIASRLPVDPDISRLVGPGSAPAVRDFARSTLTHATHHVLLVLLLVGLLAVFAALLMPRRTQPLVFDDSPHADAGAQPA